MRALPSSMIASLGTDRYGPSSTTISTTYKELLARPVAARDTSTAAPPAFFGVTRVTKAWYIDDLALGGNALARWPTLRRAASVPRTSAAITLLLRSIVPATRTQV